MNRFQFDLITIPKPDCATSFGDGTANELPDISIDWEASHSVVLNSYAATGISRAYLSGQWSRDFLYELRSRASEELGCDFAVGIGYTHGDRTRQIYPKIVLVVFSPLREVPYEIIGLEVIALDMAMLDPVTRLQIVNGLDSTVVTMTPGVRFTLSYTPDGALAFRPSSPVGLSSILGFPII